MADYLKNHTYNRELIYNISNSYFSKAQNQKSNKNDQKERHVKTSLNRHFFLRLEYKIKFLPSFSPKLNISFISELLGILYYHYFFHISFYKNKSSY